MTRALAVVATVFTLWTAARGAEIETPAGRVAPSPSPVVAPLSDGIGAQLDSALAPTSGIETSRQALDNAAQLLQGGASQAAPASAVDAGATGASAAAVELKPAQPGAKAPQSVMPRAPRPAVKGAPAGHGFPVLALALILATILAYAALIYGFTSYVSDMEGQLQQQMQQTDDWGP